MSVLTTTPLKAAPSAAAGVAITNGTAGVYGAWVEVIATTAAPIAVAGVTLKGGSYSAEWYDLDLGVGAIGVEASVGTLRLYLASSGALEHLAGAVLPVPLGGIGSGVRVAIRGRCLGASAGPATLALLYYESLSSDQVTTSSQVLTSAPTGTGTASLTPSGTAWTNSAWVELLASAASDSGLLGLAHAQTTGAGDGIEYDLGTGAAAAETVITTLRDSEVAHRLAYTWLPGLYPIAAGTRVAVRMRKAGTSTTAHPVALLYYTGVSAAGAATAQPYVWGPL